MQILSILLILLVVTRAFGELAARLGAPALVGELISGILLGLLGRHYAELFPVLSGLKTNEVFAAITDLAVFVIMLQAGVEMDPWRMARSSGAALVIALGGMLVPLALGIGLGWAYLPESPQRAAQLLLLGTALAVTAVPVSARVLNELGELKSRAGRLILSAAVFDDALSLLLLAVLTALIRHGQFPTAVELLGLIGGVVLFFAVTLALGLIVLPRLESMRQKLLGDELEFSLLLAVGLAFAMLAEQLGMHFILGAFVAGLLFSHRTRPPEIYTDVRRKLTGLADGFLGPIFFGSIGLHLDLTAVTAVPGFLAWLIVAALLGKLLGAGLPALGIGLRRREATVIGVGMSARGAVELVIADIALGAGLFARPVPTPPVVEALFSAVVVMAMVTTLLVPIVLKMLQTPEQGRERPPSS